MNNASRTTDDLSFLVGKALEQVCIGRFQAVLNFFDRAAIEVACGVEVIADGSRKTISDDYQVDVGVELVGYLGRAVSHAEVSDEAIQLQFEGGASIRFLLRGGRYESVNVSGGPEGNLTFY